MALHKVIQKSPSILGLEFLFFSRPLKGKSKWQKGQFKEER
jgi:hypothetical protein